MTEFIITRILKFVGRKLDGYKTIIGGVSFILIGILGMIRIMFPELTQLPELTLEGALASISAGITALGLGSKAEKMTNEVKKGNEIVDDCK